MLVFAIAACSGKKNQAKPDPVPPQKQEGPTADELFVKGNVKLDKNEWKGAVEAYDDALAVDDQQWEIHMNRAIALARLGKFNDALASMELALRNGGEENPVVYFNLGNLYQERGMYSESVDAYRTSLAYESSPNVDTLVNLAAAFVFLRQWDKANTTYEYIRSLAPDDPRAPHGLALVMQMQSRYQDAAQAYEMVHSIDPNFELAYYNKARCYSAMKEHQLAIDALQDYLRVAPDGAYAKRAKGLMDGYRQRLKKSQ